MILGYYKEKQKFAFLHNKIVIKYFRYDSNAFIQNYYSNIEIWL